MSRDWSYAARVAYAAAGSLACVAVLVVDDATAPVRNCDRAQPETDSVAGGSAGDDRAGRAVGRRLAALR